jgi:hypothetical protein
MGDEAGTKPAFLAVFKVLIIVCRSLLILVDPFPSFSVLFPTPGDFQWPRPLQM